MLEIKIFDTNFLIFVVADTSALLAMAACDSLRSLIQERTKTGRSAAVARGVKMGRKPFLSP